MGHVGRVPAELLPARQQAVPQGEGLDEFDPIKVDRISPNDAVAIRKGGPQATLKGLQFNSFGAFFSRAYRENDYLWGRLHGAERMIDIVVSSLPPRARMKPGRIAAIKRQAFHTILDEEEERLSAVPGLIDAIIVAPEGDLVTLEARRATNGAGDTTADETARRATKTERDETAAVTVA